MVKLAWVLVAFYLLLAAILDQASIGLLLVCLAMGTIGTLALAFIEDTP